MQDNANNTTNFQSNNTNSTPVIATNDNPHTPVPSKSSKRLLIIISSIVGVAVIGLITFFLFLRPTATLVPEGDSEPSLDDESIDYSVPIEVTTTYSTPENSEDPEQDYINHLEQQKKSAKNSTEELEAILSQASIKIAWGEYDEAKTIIDNIDMSKYPSANEQFMYYNVLSNLYDKDALNNPELYQEYYDKATNLRYESLMGQ